jgi:type II secretory pathway pseudopilin PulG
MRRDTAEKVRRSLCTPRRTAFTLVELLVVIGIIVLLVGILIPTVARVRQSAQAADTSSGLQALSSACDRYFQDFRAYPGPFSNQQIRAQDFNNIATFVNNGSPSGPFQTMTYPGPGTSGTVPAGYAGGFFTSEFQEVTGAENLVLGLLGGLSVQSVNTAGGPPYKLVYDPSAIGQGPNSLNPSTPKKYAPYLDATNLSWRTEGGLKTGRFRDDAGLANDTSIPEFVDRFADPLPILYLRARTGGAGDRNQPFNAENNNIINTMDSGITGASTGGARVGQYDLAAISGYTNSPIGVGKRVRSSDYVGGATFPNHGLRSVNLNATLDASVSGATYVYPYDAYPFFRNSSIGEPNNTTAAARRQDVAREKDRYILISAGIDRVFGTKDDLCSFGAIGN